MVDNARYHKSKLVMQKIEELKIPYMLQGVYSWDTAACEKVFSQMKSA